MRLTLNGWATLTSGPGVAVCVIEDGRPIGGSASYGAYRPDVATAMKISADSASGYSILLHPHRGTHAVGVAVLEADGRTLDPIPGTLKVTAR
jgi:hypothetical protein